MKTSFVCEKCGRLFEEQLTCQSHEQICGQSFPVKGFFISQVLFDDNHYTIKIIEYNKAVRIDQNRINLIPDSNHLSEVTINQLQLNKPHNFDSIVYGLYTTDFDKNNEKKYIELLLDYKKEDVKKELDKYIKDCQRDIDILEKKMYSIDRDKNCNILMEDFYGDNTY